MSDNIIIGVSKGSGSPRYSNYRNWLCAAEPDIEIIDLALSTDLAADMHRIHGLVLTGGVDVDPVRYERPDYRSVCEGVDLERDAREFEMLALAAEREL